VDGGLGGEGEAVWGEGRRVRRRRRRRRGEFMTKTCF
jgi:hypothetical protein